MKQIVKRLMPSFAKELVRAKLDKMRFDALPSKSCQVDNLRHVQDLSVNSIFDSQSLEGFWSESEKAIGQFGIPDSTGGVNPGDRRAVYYLISSLKPTSVLEFGTHIGSSTIHIAAAMSRYLPEKPEAKITTVDIVDVNSDTDKHWLKHEAHHSPVGMVEALGYGSHVEFITADSVDYATNCQNSYDFIFLDGDHAPSAVYQEIPLACRMLRPNGVILLHDYFPGMKPLWNDGSALPGPYMAVERLRKEGLKVEALPLGELPWPTKRESNVTSLALLLRND
ncbi:MAG: class I SAM-dependent methyltransferase [Verrucomicrobiota bacterium]